MTRTALGLLCFATLGFLLAGCGLLASPPEPASLDQRLAAFPTEGLPLKRKVVIHWDDHQIPFIDAEADEDAAFALGLVHAHLRLGQMEIAKRVAQGRISEIAGPFFTATDRSLRILGFGRTAAAVVARWPESTRRWVDAYVSGVNHYQRTMVEEPHEYRVFGLAREPWKAEDVVTLGRLGGTDVTWLTWLNLLQLRDEPDWPRIWRDVLAFGGSAPPSFSQPPARGFGAAPDETARLAALLSQFGRWGSNSVAIAPERSASGGALIASDPHLGIMVPNLWLLVGLRSPSFQAVGAMAPGIPVFAYGRNRDIAWGGTNLRAALSDLFDVSHLAPEDFEVEEQAIRRRFWFDDSVKVRLSPFGPVISDAPAVPNGGGRTFALSWMGHRASDEITAMLGVNRAANIGEFRAALIPFALPGQNFVYADADGNIGQITATRLPRRPPEPPEDMILDPVERSGDWARTVDVRELPAIVNPRSGYIASANNRPADFSIPIGWFFSPPDRIERFAELLAGDTPISVESLKTLQRDVVSLSARALRDTLVARAPANLSGPGLDVIKAWDGAYKSDSRGALAFEAALHALTPLIFRAAGRERELAVLGDSSFGRATVRRLLKELDDAKVQPAMTAALAAADQALGKYAAWSDVQRLQLAHPLGQAPVLGGRYRYADLPYEGGNETILKAAHSLKSEPGRTRYGSQARHISDMSDEDENLFVLLGGQDGWLGSTTFLDQVALWREGRYIRLPLRPESVAKAFSRAMVLTPAP